MKTFGCRIVYQMYRCLLLSKSQRHLSISTNTKKKFHRKKVDQIKGTAIWESPLAINKPEFDWTYLCDRNNLAQIKENIDRRKGIGDIDRLQATWTELQSEKCEKKKKKLEEELICLAADIPNTSSDLSPVGDESNAILLETHGNKKEFDFEPVSLHQLGTKLGLLRTENLTLTTGPSTYYFLGDLARLEQALVQYTLQHLVSSGFTVVTVPDIVHSSVIEGCGFKTTGQKTQVYRLDSQNLCLAGTAEMALAGYFTNDILSYKELPKKICAVSRCYRAETSDEVEKGIYRVHQFTKVEMFGVTAGSLKESNQLMEEVMTIQKQLFTGLGIHFRVLEMPTQELGAPAHRKVDMEAWMPNKGFWGEISSTSNCTDFQSRRLSIKYRDDQNQLLHANTVNGTACAIPRLIMNILETNQTADGNVAVPAVLKPWMNGKDLLTKKDKQMKYFQANRIEKMLKKS